MGLVNLCIAMSLDGYIADKNGSVDFVFERPRVEPDLDYRAFYEDVGCILFGHTTYRQIVREISPSKWLYPEKKCYVFSGKESGHRDHVEFTSLSPPAFVDTIVKPQQKQAWLFGGASLIASFLEADLVDLYSLYILPVILGDGIPLFPSGAPKRPLSLQRLSATDDMVKAFYQPL